MALKAVLSKAEVEALPEAMRGLYTETNGAFNIEASVLTLANEGLVPEVEIQKLKRTVGEFRDNNLALIGERDGVTAKLKTFEGVDPVEYKALKEGTKKLKEKGIDSNDELATLIANQIQKATEPLNAKVNQLTEEREALKHSVAKAAVDDHIRAAALTAGARENALDDVLSRGRSIFRYVDGKVVAMDGDKPRFSDNDPAKVLGADEWITSLAKSAEFLFKPSGGGGGNGGSGKGGGESKVMTNPSPVDFGRDLEAIANGKTEVRY
jgi:hypothetical protein